MGHPRRIRKTYSRPHKRWDSRRIEEEATIIDLYGLKNKREILKAQEKIRTFRRTARKLLSMTPEEAAKIKQELVGKLAHLGILGENATLDEVLGLEDTDIMNRRLQTLVYKRGFARTMKQARQLIVHGHVLVDGMRNTSPGTLIPRDLQDKISCTLKVPQPEEKPEQKPKKEEKKEGEKEKESTESDKEKKDKGKSEESESKKKKEEEKKVSGSKEESKSKKEEKKEGEG